MAAGAAMMTVCHANVVSWAYDNGNTIPASGTAGVVAATNWNLTGDAGSADLLDHTGASTGVSLTLAGGFGAWGIGGVSSPDADGTYNKAIFDGYYNSLGSTLALGNLDNLGLSTYDVIVYFSSDADGRTGTVSDGTTTYSFSTMGVAATSGSNAILTQTTDTGAGNPGANYAVFSGLTGTSQTFTIANASDGMGFAGVQVIPEPATIGLVGVFGAGVLFIRRRFLI